VKLLTNKIQHNYPSPFAQPYLSLFKICLIPYPKTSLGHGDCLGEQEVELAAAAGENKVFILKRF
jgi:hypothetical protein